MKKIAIIGSGVVGSATGKGFASKGNEVIFYDVKETVIEALSGQGFRAKHFDLLNVDESEVFFLVLPTPTENNEINLNYLQAAVRKLGKKLKEKKEYFVVVVRSTVLPGTTEDLVASIIEEESGKKVGKDFGLAMNPEYLREKNAEDDFKNPWLVTVGSLDQRSKDFLQEIFEGLPCPVYYVSIREAETQKYVHNLYNAVKIAFFNEMRMACEKIEINPGKIFEITTESAEGFWNKNYGIRDFGPFDGMCLPKDTQAFSSWAKKVGAEMDLLNGAISSNKKFEIFWKKRAQK